MRITVVFAACLAAAPALAEAPDLKTPAPVIYLAENLDEKDNLGWCIDTLGRGYAENLQTHSCKPQGGDVQFSFDAASGQIRSVEFAGKCMELIAPDDPKIAFGLRDCSDGTMTQQFAFDTASGRITPKDQPDNCVTAGNASRSAGPFMSRDLILAPCASADAALITWRDVRRKKKWRKPGLHGEMRGTGGNGGNPLFVDGEHRDQAETGAQEILAELARIACHPKLRGLEKANEIKQTGKTRWELNSAFWPEFPPCDKCQISADCRATLEVHADIRWELTKGTYPENCTHLGNVLSLSEALAVIRLQIVSGTRWLVRTLAVEAQHQNRVNIFSLTGHIFKNHCALSVERRTFQTF